MGFGAYGTYQTASRWLGAPLLKTSITFLPQDAPITPLESDMLLKTGAALFLAIIVGAAIYFAALFAVKALRKEDIQMITKRG